MMDFDKMKMTHERIGNGKYRVRVGHDIVEAETYIDNHGAFCITMIDHYIKTEGNKPTNPGRTHALMFYVEDYLERVYKKEIAEDMREIAALPADTYLQERFNGQRLHLAKGTTPYEVIQKLDQAYYACIRTGGNSYYLLKELSQMPDGFLAEELNKLFSF